MSGRPGRPRPLIGLSGRRRTGADIAGFPGSLGHLPIDLYLADYATGILAAGGLPVHLPMDADPAGYGNRLDGVLLSGGADIEPGRYGADPDGHGDYEPERDRLELGLLASARDHGLPVLGICRGLQVINVAAGGSLHQHVPEHARYDVDPAGNVHDVRFDPGSLLATIHAETTEATTGGAARRGVNSLHHQTVDRVGDGLVVTARADDGTIEGLESPDGDLVAVQWHPEMLTGVEPVFDWLVTRSGERANHG